MKMTVYSLAHDTSSPARTRGSAVCRPIAVIASSVAVLSVAEAAPIAVRIDDALSPAYTCNDGSACDLTATPDGVVTLSQSISNWFVTVTTGVGYGDNGQGSPLDPYLHLNDINVRYDTGSSASNPLTVMVSETGFNTATATDFFSLSTGGVLDKTRVKIDAYLDTGNTLFGTGTLLGSLGPYQDPPSSFSDLSFPSGSTPGLFSLTLVATFLPTSTTGIHTSSLDAELKAVPIPAALWLFGSALAGMGIIGRRKQVTA